MIYTSKPHNYKQKLDWYCTYVCTRTDGRKRRSMSKNKEVKLLVVEEPHHQQPQTNNQSIKLFDEHKKKRLEFYSLLILLIS